MGKAGNVAANTTKSRAKSKLADFVDKDDDKPEEENKSGNLTHVNLREEPEIHDFDGPVIAERLEANMSGEKQHIDIISALNSSIVNSNNNERVEDAYYSQKVGGTSILIREETKTLPFTSVPA